MAKKKQVDDTIVDVQEVYTKTEMFVDRNRKALTIGISAVALAVIAFFAYQKLVVEPKNAEASESIWKAEMYFEQDSLDLALNGDGLYMGFDEISEEFSNTNIGLRAAYYAGCILRDQAKYEEALDRFMVAKDLDDNAIGVLAMGNLADMYVEMDDIESGAEWMDKAAKRAAASTSDDFSAPMYYFKAATLNMELERYAEAKSQLDFIIENYPTSSEYPKAVKWSKSLVRHIEG